MKKIPLVMVAYEDITGKSSWEYEGDSDFELGYSYITGWRLKTDRGYLLIACQKVKQDGEWSYADRHKIPRGCVKSIRRIE